MPVAITPHSDQRERRLLLITVGRLAVATVLLSGTLYAAMVARPWLWSFTPRVLAGLIAATYTAALGSALWLRLSREPLLIARTQVATDILLTTGMIYVTGGGSSGFTFLYGISVLMAALVAGSETARAAGAASVALYLGLALGLASGWIEAPPDQVAESYGLTTREVFFGVTVNVLGLSLVTVLSNNLAERIQTAGGLLRAAEESAAELARLNDDIVRSLTSGLVTTEPNGRVRMVNPTGLQMLRLTAENAVGRDVHELLPLRAPLSVLSDEGENKRHEDIARRANGESFPLGYSVTPLISADGVESGWIVVFQDLTEISLLRAEAERAQHLASLGRLAAGLAHEIRNPLSSIAGSVEMVRDSSSLDAEDRHLLSLVLTESERLNELVSTMLQVSKPVAPRRIETDIAQVAREVTAMAQANRAEASGIFIRHRAEGTVLAIVDEDQMRQVLWNLLKNAIQASPKGSSIDIAVVQTDDEVILSVTDQGVGIDPSQRDRIFDMFYSERTHGAGIGLALVRQLVDGHGGTIEARSNVGPGATFRVALPKRPSEPHLKPPA